MLLKREGLRFGGTWALQCNSCSGLYKKGFLCVKPSGWEAEIHLRLYFGHAQRFEFGACAPGFKPCRHVLWTWLLLMREMFFFKALTGTAMFLESVFAASDSCRNSSKKFGLDPQP